MRGQYLQGWVAGERAVGYLEEANVPPTSTTETYVAVRLGIQNRRWAGVPFYIRTGKRMPRRVTEIAVLFNKAPHLPFDAADVELLGNNQLVIRVQPDEGVTLKFGSKVPGTTMEVRDITMDFQYGEAFTESSPEAYERLVLDVLDRRPARCSPRPRRWRPAGAWSTRSSRPGPAPRRSPTGPASGVPAPPTRCSPARAGPGDDRDELCCAARAQPLVLAFARMGLGPLRAAPSSSSLAPVRPRGPRPGAVAESILRGLM